jgi:hypothetical protein
MVACAIARSNGTAATAALLARHARRLQRERRDLGVGADEHAQHARRGLGRRRVDRADLRVRMRRAQDSGVRDVLRPHVVDIAPHALEQRDILLPKLGTADRIFTHDEDSSC